MYKMMETTHTNQANAETTELKNHLGGGQAWLRAGDSGPENTVTSTCMFPLCKRPGHPGQVPQRPRGMGTLRTLSILNSGCTIECSPLLSCSLSLESSSQCSR